MFEEIYVGDVRFAPLGADSILNTCARSHAGFAIACGVASITEIKRTGRRPMVGVRNQF